MTKHTESTLRAMPAEDLMFLVAKALGHEVRRDSNGVLDSRPACSDFWREVPPYPDDIGEAMRALVEECEKRGWSFELTRTNGITVNHRHVLINNLNGPHFASVRADKDGFALSICIALVLASQESQP